MIDFCVIGGGIAGVSVAARLSALGTVVVLEREAGLAYHASGRSAAMFEENYGNAATVALNRASRDHHENADGGVLRPRGLLMVGHAGEAAAFANDSAAMGLQPLSMQEALVKVPIIDPRKVDRAAYHADALDIDTDLLIQNFARVLRGNGGRVVTNAAVTAIARTATGWAVTAGAAYETRYLVNAAGAWADEVAVLAGLLPIGLQPYRRSMARIPAPGGLDVTEWPMLFGPGETWYAKPDAGALIVSPADEDPVPPRDVWADDTVLAEGLDRYAQHVTEPVDRLLSSWAGLRTFVSDRTVVLGLSPEDPAFIWCAGQGGYGFQTAPAASQLVADIIGGRPAEVDRAVVDAVSPARFGG